MHKAEEVAASNAERDAQRILDEIKVTQRRSAESAQSLAKHKADTTGKGTGAELKPRTAYEARMRATYGSGVGTKAVGGVGTASLEFDPL